MRDDILHPADSAVNWSVSLSAIINPFSIFNPVLGLPYIRPIPKITAVAEADVSIKCPVSGYPILEIVWSKGE